MRCEPAPSSLDQSALTRLQDELESILHDQARANPLATVSNWVAFCWSYELAVISGQPITVGKIAGGIFFVILGLLLARLASRELGRHIFPRLGLNPGAVVAMQSISFYVLSVLLSFVALELANLPFATFTFLGGAAAIGIGFGSQNVCNNFISGLILLAEQPIRVGDLVEIEGVRGTIESIGARSTRMKTLANHEIMVPNSQLLQDKVTNLTLSDDLVRASIEVKIGPILPVDEITRRLLAAANTHHRVLTNPEPVVLFLGFSATELSFELHFWVKLESLIESRLVESEVRTAICDTLREPRPRRLRPGPRCAKRADLTSRAPRRSARTSPRHSRPPNQFNRPFPHDRRLAVIPSIHAAGLRAASVEEAGRRCQDETIGHRHAGQLSLSPPHGWRSNRQLTFHAAARHSTV